MTEPRGSASSEPRKTLILGGTGGIGRSIAEALANRPGIVQILGRNPHKLDELIRQLQATPGCQASFIGHCIDLDDPTKLPELEGLCQAIDALIICRGAFVEKKLGETTTAEWLQLSYSNLNLPGILASHAAKAMASRGFGRILLFGGTRTETVRGYRHNAAYAAAKTGLAVVLKSLVAEFAAQGVAAAMICPGFVDTEYLSQANRERLQALSPRKKLMQPEDIARLALFLLDGAMDCANGAIINADEGLYSL